MSVQFIIGRSGTGKTSYCIKAIVDALVGSSDNRPLLLLVPEQATYQAERAILADKRVGGYHRLYVLSFDRLQFLLGGRNTAVPVLSPTGRQMIIHKILRDHKSRLKLLGGSAESVGLAGQMVETIAELLRYAKTPDDIEQLVEELEKNEGANLALLKFADVGLIFKEYLKFIEGRFTDPDAQLVCAKKLIGNAEFAKGARLWVDGFSGFTTAEFEVLVELLKAAGDSQIALCMDASNINLANPNADGIEAISLFNPTEQTYVEFFDVIKKNKLGLKEPVVLEQAIRFSNCPELAHIERNIFNVEADKISVSENIRFVSAGNARGEVRFAAKEIVRLVREKGYRYRDIAVIASDINSYEHYIRAYFEDYDIPFFIDKRKPLNQHPVVQLICSALQTITEGFSFGDIFTYLKTDLVPVERCRVDELENYCLAFGIEEDEWLSPEDWHLTAKDDDSFDEQQINQIRHKVSLPLLELRGKLIDKNDQRREVTGCQFRGIIFEFLEVLGVREKVGAWVEQAVEAGDLQTADEHRQFFDRLVTVFDELVDVFGEQKMDCLDYLAIINCAFSQLTLAFIPPTLDQVLIGSIERSRHPALKAVFLTGATQKQFPSPLLYSSVLSDDDRTIAEEMDFYLAPAMSQSLVERQYLGYIAFTRPCELLYVTYPLADEKGNAMMRTQFVGDIEALFENFCEEPDTQGQLGIENIHTENELAELLCSCLGQDVAAADANGCEPLGDLLEDIYTDDELRQVGTFAKSAINYENPAQLDSGVVKRLFGNQLKSSVSRLGTFAACPYKYFACYILGLKERKEVKFEPLDIGQFYHSVLDAWLKRVKLTKKRFKEIKDGELTEILDQEIQKLVKSDSFISNFVRHSGHNKFIIHTVCERLEEALVVLAEMIRAGDFEPGCSEVVFGQENEGLGEYKIRLSKKKELFLYGKIDRLDIADVEGEKAAAVFDYKRRDKTFSWKKFYHGLDMQLLVYILALRNTSGDKYKIRNAIGGFYIPIEITPDKVTLNKVKEKSSGTSHKAKGIFNGEFFDRFDNRTDSNWSNFYNFAVTKGKGQYAYYGSSGVLTPEDFENTLQFTRKKIAELAEEILCGSIDIRPYKLGPETACQYCKYRAVCRFDWLINDYNYLESLGKLSVLEKMKDGNG